MQWALSRALPWALSWALPWALSWALQWALSWALPSASEISPALPVGAWRFPRARRCGSPWGADHFAGAHPFAAAHRHRPRRSPPSDRPGRSLRYEVQNRRYASSLSPDWLVSSSTKGVEKSFTEGALAQSPGLGRALALSIAELRSRAIVLAIGTVFDCRKFHGVAKLYTWLGRVWVFLDRGYPYDSKGNWLDRYLQYLRALLDVPKKGLSCVPTRKHRKF